MPPPPGMSPPALVTWTDQPSPVKFAGMSFTPAQQARVLMLADLILRGSHGDIGRGGFAREVGSRIELVDVAVCERPEDGKMHAEVACEIDVHEDMLNAGGNLHGGCTMFMIDVCSSVTLHVLGIARGLQSSLVSQAITTVFHAPAAMRLVATGIHNQMAPSEPKL
uniref:Thioesterase domain-containing protein n=1 Tax=Ganoderma boninense TaxID=34458 RepID=A0A5K1K5J0_9APHY|nr:Uncharacterized protein [Ganoderma boninense]